jgi:putative membrane protein
VVQWIKASEREARRVDRELDRQEARERAQDQDDATVRSAARD